MAVDSNMPYQRVNVQANNNDTIWNGAAYGAGAGLGAAGLTYGATTHGARGLDTLNSKVAGSKTTRMQTRNTDRLIDGKRAFPQNELKRNIGKVNARSGKVSKGLGHIQSAGSGMFGSKKRAIGTVATGLMGGMLAGGITDHYK
jgi:hypothetical protein